MKKSINLTLVFFIFISISCKKNNLKDNHIKTENNRSLKKSRSFGFGLIGCYFTTYSSNTRQYLNYICSIDENNGSQSSIILNDPTQNFSTYNNFFLCGISFRPPISLLINSLKGNPNYLDVDLVGIVRQFTQTQWGNYIISHRLIYINSTNGKYILGPTLTLAFTPSYCEFDFINNKLISYDSETYKLYSVNINSGVSNFIYNQGLDNTLNGWGQYGFGKGFCFLNNLISISYNISGSMLFGNAFNVSSPVNSPNFYNNIGSSYLSFQVFPSSIPLNFANTATLIKTNRVSFETYNDKRYICYKDGVIPKMYIYNNSNNLNPSYNTFTIQNLLTDMSHH